MRSTFFGLDIANKGLFVAQKQIDVTGHNISNANTDGYSRQRFITAAVPPPGGPQQFAPVAKGQVGGGVLTLSLDQIRDKFLDRQFRQEQSKLNYWETKSEALYYVEDVFNGDYSISLSGIMGTFFNAVQELSKNPTDEAIRTNLTQEAKKLTDVMHTYYSQLKDLMYQQDYALAQQVSSINEISQQVADLNENIFKYEQGGQVANDLRDTRNLLLDQLAALADIQYQEVGTGKYNINGLELTTLEVTIGVNGDELISHTSFRELEALRNASNPVVDAIVPETEENHLHSIRFVDNEELLELSGGKLQGYIDIRDGNTKENQGIPYFLAQIDLMAQSLVETFNDIHRQGYTVPYTDKDGISYESRNGIDFFDSSSLTAATIRLSDAILGNDDILGSGFNIAASSLPVYKDEDGHFNTGNNEIALELIKGVKEKNDIPIIGSFEGFFKSFISELASEVGHSKQMELAENVLVDSLTSQRLSVMGVSIDEEMTNLVKFQHCYNAAARTITAMDEMLDVLINRTGRAGL